MANKKITDLNEATSVSNNDWLVIVDVANDETKKVHASEVGGNIPIQDTAPASPEEDDLWIDTSEPEEMQEAIKNEHSDSTTDTYACDFTNGVLLYDDSTGSSSEITLSDDISNYSRIKIFYTSTVEDSYEFKPSGATLKIALGTKYKTSSLFVQTIGTYSCNGNKLTPQLDECGYCSTSTSGSTMHWDNTNYCNIKKVVGYKY